jgi:RNA-directed DNA polymerase
MRVKLNHSFNDIISVENLLEAWNEFVKGKKKRMDVKEFSLNLIDNIISLHNNLVSYDYVHGDYQAFKINDPKPRNIHKASVRDRLLHHAIYRKLYPFFDRIFISDSFSCRLNKGTHRAINRFRSFAYKAGKNNTRVCWILKCDIKKFFANINHEILKRVLAKYIIDSDILWLLAKMIDGFNSDKPGVGLPLGNLTSQLFVNIYMNEFDKFVKHKLRAKYYVRYTDDFIILSENKDWLIKQIVKIQNFLNKNLKLSLHPDKLFVKTFYSGLDFLGWLHFSDHRVLRTGTKRRMIKRLKENPKMETINSYSGLLKHGNTHRLQKIVNFL